VSFLKKIGKKLKKLGKKIGKVVSKVAPLAAFIPGVGTAIAGAAGALGSVLGKGGKYAQGYADKLGAVKQMLDTGKKGSPAPTNANLAQLEQPQEPEQQPTAAAPTSAPVAGMDSKTLLIGGAALVALVLMMRRK
jgi:hypothetical protein